MRSSYTYCTKKSCFWYNKIKARFAPYFQSKAFFLGNGVFGTSPTETFCRPPEPPDSVPQFEPSGSELKRSVFDVPVMERMCGAYRRERTSRFAQRPAFREANSLPGLPGAFV